MQRCPGFIGFIKTEFKYLIGLLAVGAVCYFRFAATLIFWPVGRFPYLYHGARIIKTALSLLFGDSITILLLICHSF